MKIRELLSNPDGFSLWSDLFQNCKCFLVRRNENSIILRGREHLVIIVQKWKFYRIGDFKGTWPRVLWKNTNLKSGKLNKSEVCVVQHTQLQMGKLRHYLSCTAEQWEDWDIPSHLQSDKMELDPTCWERKNTFWITHLLPGQVLLLWGTNIQKLVQKTSWCII